MSREPDEAADKRDRDARKRDLRAAVRDRAAGPDIPDNERRAREEAAADRRAAAEDRRAAARDRGGLGEEEEAHPAPRLRLVRDDRPAS